MDVYVVELVGCSVVGGREIHTILEHYGAIDDVIDELESEYNVHFQVFHRSVDSRTITWKAENADLYIILTTRTLR